MAQATVATVRVPNAIRAHVGETKVLEYLLAPRHADGGTKFVLFSRLGYSRSRWRQLEADLRRHVQTRRVAEEASTSYGTKYVVRGSFRGRSGRTIELVTVWIIRNEETFPRLVTAYPGG